MPVHAHRVPIVCPSCAHHVLSTYFQPLPLLVMSRGRVMRQPGASHHARAGLRCPCRSPMPTGTQRTPGVLCTWSVRAWSSWLSCLGASTRLVCQCRICVIVHACLLLYVVNGMDACVRTFVLVYFKAAFVHLYDVCERGLGLCFCACDVSLCIVCVCLCLCACVCA